MKARIPLDKRTRKLINEAADEATERVLRQKEFKLINRVLKTCCYVLNRSFDFGKTRRLPYFLSAVFKTLDNKDELFWEHLDRVVIDELGLPFDREEVDLDGEPID